MTPATARPFSSSAMEQRGLEVQFVQEAGVNAFLQVRRRMAYMSRCLVRRLGRWWAKRCGWLGGRGLLRWRRHRHVILQDHDEFAHLHPLSNCQREFGLDPMAFHKGAIAAAQINDAPFSFHEAQFAVMAADPDLFKHHVVVRLFTEADDCALEWHRARCAGLGVLNQKRCQNPVLLRVPMPWSIWAQTCFLRPFL